MLYYCASLQITILDTTNNVNGFGFGLYRNQTIPVKWLHDTKLFGLCVTMFLVGGCKY